MALNKAYDMVGRALKTQRGYKNTEREVKTQVLMPLLGKHYEERKRDVHIIHHTVFVVTGGDRMVSKVNKINN